MFARPRLLHVRVRQFGSRPSTHINGGMITQLFGYAHGVGATIVIRAPCRVNEMGVVILFAMGFHFVNCSFLLGDHAHGAQLRRQATNRYSSYYAIMRQEVFIFKGLSVMQTMFTMPIRVVYEVTYHHGCQGVLSQRRCGYAYFAILAIVFLSQFLTYLLYHFSVFFGQFCDNFLRF